jgi:predicted nucleic acid-binding protein
MTLVFDATPLIYLAKADRLGVLTDLEDDLVIPGRVYKEVVDDGMKRGYPDAKRINNHLRDGLFGQRTFEKNERFENLVENTSLSSADVAVLLLADDTNGTAVMDEQHGREVADVEGIETRGTAYLLLSLVKRGDLPAEEARDTIDEMLDAGWHCSPNLYAEIIRKLDELAPEE